MKTRFFLILAIFFNTINLGAQIEQGKTFSIPKHEIVCSAFSADSKYIATGGFDKKIIICDALKGTVIKELTGLKDFPLSVAFSTDGNYLISGGKDSKVTIWNLQTGKFVSLNGHSADVTSVDISTGNLIASASKDKTIRIWDINGTLVSTLKGHTQEVNSVKFNYDGSKLVSGGADGKVIEWDVRNAKLIRSVEAHEGWTRCVAYNYNGTLIASGGDDGKIHIWNSSDGKLQNSIIAHSKWVQTLAFSPDGKYILSGGHDNYLVLINSITGEFVFHSPKQDFFVLSVAFNLNGKDFISSTLYSDKLHVWDASALGIQSMAGNSTVSRAKPVITWNNQNNLTSDKLNFKIDALLKSESEVSSVDIYVNGNKFSSERKLVTSNQGFDIDFKKVIFLNAGENKVRLTAYNAGGETISDELTVTYTQPQEVIAPPVAVIPKTKASISWKSQNNINVDTVLPGISAFIKSESAVNSVDVYVNDKQVSAEKINQANKSDFNVEFQKAIALKEGLNTVKLIASNEGGQSTSDILNITYVKPVKIVKPPEVVIPKTKASLVWKTSDNLNVENASAKVNASIKSDTKISSVDVYLNNKKISTEKELKGNGPGFNIDLEKAVDLTEGLNSLKLVAVNEAGESSSELLWITYIKPQERIAMQEKQFEMAIPPAEPEKPKTKPKVAWKTPDNTKVENLSAKILATIKSDTKVTMVDIFLNNKKILSEKELTASGTDFNIDLEKAIDLSEGLNTLRLVASNEAGESSSEPLWITYTKPKEIIAAVVKIPEEKKVESTPKEVPKPVEKITEVAVAKGFPTGAELLKDLPKNSQNQYRYAVIIGNEDYSSFQTGLQSESNVQFAVADAKAFKEYAVTILGVPEENVMLLTNARAIEMDNTIGKLNPIIKALNGKAEIVFFYAGHGFPDEQTKEAYLIPVDVSGTNLKFAIKLKDMYSSLTEFPSKRITVFIDACFSGGAREQGLLSARAVRINPKSNPLNGNVVVFTASSGNESALPYKEKEHGIFTYFLLAKLKETGGKITYKELSDYIIEQVGVKSVLVNNKPQTPQTNVSMGVANSWANWKIN
jgi:WD40 repeat protein